MSPDRGWIEKRKRIYTDGTVTVTTAILYVLTVLILLHSPVKREYSPKLLVSIQAIQSTNA